MIRILLAGFSFMCYFILTCGVMVSQHYCMNRLETTTRLFSAASEVCGKCGMQTGSSKGCCKNEVRIIKLQTDQQNTVGYRSVHPDIAGETALSPVNYEIGRLMTVAMEAWIKHPPPPDLSHPRFLRLRTILI